MNHANEFLKSLSFNNDVGTIQGKITRFLQEQTKNKNDR